MEHDRSPPPRRASPRIGSAGDEALGRGEAEGTPPVLLCGRTARLSPGAGRRGGSSHPSFPNGFAFPPRGSCSQICSALPQRRCGLLPKPPPRSRALPQRSARSPLVEGRSRVGVGTYFYFIFFFAVSSNFSTCKQPSSCPAGGEVMSAGRALPSWHNAGLKGTAGAPTGGPRAAAAAHRRAGAEPFRLPAERAAIKLSVWDE